MIPARTLSRFIRGEERKHWEATGELSDLLSSIALGVKSISALVRTAGFKGLEGYTGRINVQGEKTFKLDEEADRTLVDVLATSGHFGLLVSEERDAEVEAPPGFEGGKYIVAFDPLDGASNVGLNIPVGTIFTVLRKKELNRPALPSDFLQPGSEIVAAGYSVYGSRTTFVYSTGAGVHSFTLDPEIGEFMLTDEMIRCPPHAPSYSINEGYSERWTPEIARFVARLKTVNPEIDTPYSSRYVGSLVADVDRVLRKGGLFLYPSDKQQPRGKLRLLYECMPLAYIIEQAGGLAISEPGPILDIVPGNIHERSPLIIGSRLDVEWYRREVFAAGSGTI